LGNLKIAIFQKFCRDLIRGYLNGYDFLVFQNAYGQEELNVQEGTHRYTPVKEISADQLETGGSGEKPPPSSESLPNPTDFWKDNPLSPATVEVTDASFTFVILKPERPKDLWSEILRFAQNDNQIAPRNDSNYESDLYAFDQALDLIRPEFAAAGSVAKNGAYGF